MYRTEIGSGGTGMTFIDRLMFLCCLSYVFSKTLSAAIKHSPGDVNIITISIENENLSLSKNS